MLRGPRVRRAVALAMVRLSWRIRDSRHVAVDDESGFGLNLASFARAQ